MSRLGRSRPADHVIQPAFLVISSNDVGNGVDSSTFPTASTSDSDIATGTEISVPIVSLSNSDLGNDSETVSLSIVGSDTYSGVSATPSIGISNSDNFSSVDVNSLTTNIIDTENISSTDSFQISATLSTVETISSAEQGSLGSQSVSSSDAMNSVDSQSLIVSINNNDVGSGIGSIISLVIPTVDIFSGTDSFVLSFSSTDTISSSDLVKNIYITDIDIFSTSIDNGIVSISISSNDSVLSLESLSLSPLGTENISGVDNGFATQSTRVDGDTGSATEGMIVSNIIGSNITLLWNVTVSPKFLVFAVPA